MMDGQEEMKAVKKAIDRNYRKIIFIIMILLVIFTIFILCIKFLFQKQVKYIIKSSLCFNVLKKEDELLEVISILNEGDTPVCIHRNQKRESMVPYKELGDKKISRTFKDFQLIGIDSNEKGYVAFTVYPYADLLWDGYLYGFYYSEDDEPVDIRTGEKCDLEFEGDGLTYFWYRTEKIADNWWYYESIFKVNFLFSEGGIASLGG